MATTPRDPRKTLLRLLVTNGPDKGQIFFLQPSREALIGRASGAELRLTDLRVSTRHCLVRSTQGMALLEDLKSSNGTYLNGERIKTHALDEDAQLEAGLTTVELKWVASGLDVPAWAPEAAGALPEAPREEGPVTVKLKREDAERLADAKAPREPTLQDFRRAQGLVGRSIGPYKLEEMIGVGLLGYVYRVQDTQTQAEAALKLILRSHARTPQILDGFLRECNTGLRVLGAARLLAVGSENEFAYVVMEYARGHSLQALLEAGQKLAAAEVVKLAVPLCETLDTAHGYGVVHRDVKPADIVLPADGPPVLLDLGLGTKRDTEGRSLLGADARLEPLAYAAPELLQEGARVDGRADLYSLAATLFYALRGCAPFAAPTHLGMLHCIRSEKPPLLSSLRPDVPQAFAEAIGKALEKEPASRFLNMLEFAEALQKAVQA
ncbi:MAG: FHA domain-containing serine/threonine-protein kinase [Planctomycetota bacterium]